MVALQVTPTILKRIEVTFTYAIRSLIDRHPRAPFMSSLPVGYGPSRCTSACRSWKILRSSQKSCMQAAGERGCGNCEQPQGFVSPVIMSPCQAFGMSMVSSNETGHLLLER